MGCIVQFFLIITLTEFQHSAQDTKFGCWFFCWVRHGPPGFWRPGSLRRLNCTSQWGQHRCGSARFVTCDRTTFPVTHVICLWNMSPSTPHSKDYHKCSALLRLCNLHRQGVESWCRWHFTSLIFTYLKALFNKHCDSHLSLKRYGPRGKAGTKPGAGINQREPSWFAPLNWPMAIDNASSSVGLRNDTNSCNSYLAQADWHSRTAQELNTNQRRSGATFMFSRHPSPFPLPLKLAPSTLKPKSSALVSNRAQCSALAAESLSWLSSTPSTQNSQPRRGGALPHFQTPKFHQWKIHLLLQLSSAKYFERNIPPQCPKVGKSGGAWRRTLEPNFAKLGISTWQENVWKSDVCCYVSLDIPMVQLGPIGASRCQRFVSLSNAKTSAKEPTPAKSTELRHFYMLTGRILADCS